MSLTPYVSEEVESLEDSEEDYSTDESDEIEPTKTYRIDFQNKRILGTIDNFDSVFQSIQKILSTDKYMYSIYDWYYGNELSSLVGKPYEYVKSEIPRIVKEALEDDDRILDVTDFSFNRLSADTCEISFSVQTIYGEIPYGIEVNL